MVSDPRSTRSPHRGPLQHVSPSDQDPEGKGRAVSRGPGGSAALTRAAEGPPALKERLLLLAANLLHIIKKNSLRSGHSGGSELPNSISCIVPIPVLNIRRTYRNVIE